MATIFSAEQAVQFTLNTGRVRQGTVIGIVTLDQVDPDYASEVAMIGRVHIQAEGATYKIPAERVRLLPPAPKFVNHELKMNAIRLLAIQLRADGPCSIANLKGWLLDQCVGVYINNVDMVFDAAWAVMNHKRCPMVQEYEMFSPRPDDVKTYTIADRMYDDRGNYKGAE